MKWRDVNPGNSFMTRHQPDGYDDDVWVVLTVVPSDDVEGFIKFTYCYLHQLNKPGEISEFSVDPECTVDYDLMFEPK